MKLALKLFLFSTLVALSLLIGDSILAQSQPNQPLILEIKKQDGVYLNRPLIVGLNPQNTDVLVYLNGEFSGLAHVNESETKTSNFYYQPVVPLGAGQYQVTVLAREKISLLMSELSQASNLRIYDLSAPTLIAPNSNTVFAKVKPEIIGLTRHNTRVHIFIDGAYNGKTNFVQSKNETANFKYEPFLNLNVGAHVMWAIAEDRKGNKSLPSQALKFNIEEPFPAPTLITPLTGSEFNKPIIVGVAKNNSLVRVFIDKVFYGEFLVENNISGVASFNYVPFVALSPGDHLIYTSAVDSRGKESIWSNIVYYHVIAPEFSDSNLAEDLLLINALEDDIEVLGEESEIIDETGIISESGVIEELQDIINVPQNEPGETTGTINEERENQGKLKLNLAIFIIFLLSVIAWIFWVNRELIKERQEKIKHDN